MKDHVFESNGVKFLVFNAGWGYEIKEIKQPMFDRKYIVKSIRFILWSMVYFTAIALLVLNYVSSK